MISKKSLERLINNLGSVSGIGMFLSLVVALQSSGVLLHAPSVPNPQTGHVIRMAVRGVGVVYITNEEWEKISPYWNTFYICVGGFAACVVARFLLSAYSGFMDGWRSDGS